MILELPVLEKEKQTGEIAGELRPDGRRARPEWLRVKLPSGESVVRLKELIQSKHLHTVCEEARCPNMAECWNAGTATFMILGDTCTRSCGFCAVKTGRPPQLDEEEPEHVAEAIANMQLKHAVITSVNRDELPDGGSILFGETIRAVRRKNPSTRIEVLIPDFKGKQDCLDRILDAKPDVLNHNTETVPSLYRKVRPQARYAWSLEVLRYAKQRGFTTKTGIMLGLGEEISELHQVMEDLVKVGLDILTLGQYLQPSPYHLPVHRFVTPEEFDSLRETGLRMGLRYVESGPLVRSSYHAERQA